MMKPSKMQKSLFRKKDGQASLAVVAAAAAVMVGGAGMQARAADRTWTPVAAGDETNFNNAANWTGGLPGTSDRAVFPNPIASFQPTLTTSTQIQGISFNTSGYVLSGVDGVFLTLTNTSNGNNNAAIYAANNTGLNEVAADIILGGAVGSTHYFRQAALNNSKGVGGGFLTISGDISSTNAIAGLSLQPASNNSSTVFTLSGNNTFNGDLTVGWATVNLNSAGAMGSGTGHLRTSNNGDFDNTSGAALTLAKGVRTGSGTFTFKGTNDLTFSGSSDFTSGSGLNVDAGRLTLNGVNFGTAQTQKGGNGTLVLNATGTGTGASASIGGVSYNVAMRLNAGALEFGHVDALSTGALDLRSGTIQAGSSLASPLTNTIVIASGTPTIGGSNAFEIAGPLILSNGASSTTTINVTNTASTLISGNVSLTDVASSDNQTLAFNVGATAGPFEISGAIQNSTVASTAVGGLRKTGDGSMKLSGGNTYTGLTDVQQGTLQLTGSLASTSVNLGGGSNSGKLILGDASGPVNLNLTSLTTAGSGTSNAIVGGAASISMLSLTNTTDNTFSGVLGGAGTNENNIGLTKNGPGALTIVGTNTYGGATNVTGGKLVAAGGVPNSDVTLAAGTAFDGAGNVKSITAGNGAAISQGAGSDTVMSLNSLTLSGGADLNLVTRLSNAGSARLAISGLLSTSGADSIDLTVSTLDAVWANGVYELISYGSLAGSGFSAFPSSANVNVIGLTPRQSKTLTDSGSGMITLQIAGPVGLPTWSGAVNGNWDYSTNNWDLDLSPTSFISGDRIVFDASGANQNITITTANVNPSRADFDGGAYSITGTSYGIVGTGLINVNSGASLALSGPNTYSGGTTVTDATLAINSASAIGTGNLTIGGTGLTSLANTSGSAVTLSTNNAQTWDADFTFSGPNDLNLGTGAVTKNGTRSITVTGGKLTVGGDITGTGSINKLGAGALALAGNNSFNATVNVNAGELEFAGGTTNMASNTIWVAPSAGNVATLRISGGTLNADQLLIAGSGNMANPTAPVGNVIQTGGIVNSSRWVVVGHGSTYDGASLPSGTYSISGGQLNVLGQRLEIATNLGAQGVLNVSGTGQVNMYNNTPITLGVNSGSTGGAYDGTINQNGGSITFYSDAGSTVGGTGYLSLGHANDPGYPGFYTPNYIYNLNGGTLTVPQIQRDVDNIGDALAIFNFNGGTLAAAGNNSNWIRDLDQLNIQAGGANVSSNGFDVTIAQNLQGSGALTKLGTGSLTLAGSNGYSGATTVTGGTLRVAGSINSSSGIQVDGVGAKLVNAGTNITSAVTLTQGIVDGTGSYGNVTVASNAANVVTHGDGTTGQLAFNNLTFNGAGQISIDATGGTPGIAVNNLIANGAADSVTVNAANSGWLTGQTYNLISYSGSLTGFSAFTEGTITGLAARQTATLSNPAGYLALTIGGDTPIWTGALSGNWTTAVLAEPKNWKLQTAGTTTDFLATDQVLFDDTATGSTDVVISDADVAPNSVVFNNTSKDYAINGPYGIANGSIIKNGTGKVTLNTASTFSGTVQVNAGTINVPVAGALGNSSGVTIASGAALELQGGVTTNPVPVTINGAGLAASPAGALRNVSGLNSYSGLLALGSNATIQSEADTLTLSNTTSSGAILGNNHVLTLAGSGNGVVSGAIVGAGTSLVKEGSGTWRLDGESTFTGGTTVNGGVLELANGGGTASLRGPIVVNNGGTLKTAAGDALGYSSGAQVTELTLNAGGTFDTTYGGNQGYRTKFVMNGGAVTAGGNLNFTSPAEGFATPQVLAKSGSTSIINANITIRNDNLTVETEPTSTLSINGNIGGGGQFIKNGAGTLILGGNNSFGGQATVNAGKVIAASGGAFASRVVNVSDGALVQVQQDLGTPVTISNLVPNGSGSIDLTNGALVLNNGSAATVLGWLDAGYDVGFASGPIHSSLADASHGIGWKDDGAITVAYAYYGDINLDGQVDGLDLNILGSNWQQSGNWSLGDLNYDGITDGLDLNLLGSNWQAGVAAPSSISFASAVAAAGFTSIPEPASLALLGTAAVGLMRRRRSAAA